MVSMTADFDLSRFVNGDDCDYGDDDDLCGEGGVLEILDIKKFY